MDQHMYVTMTIYAIQAMFSFKTNINFSWRLLCLLWCFSILSCVNFFPSFRSSLFSTCKHYLALLDPRKQNYKMIYACFPSIYLLKFSLKTSLTSCFLPLFQMGKHIQFYVFLAWCCSLMFRLQLYALGLNFKLW